MSKCGICAGEVVLGYPGSSLTLNSALLSPTNHRPGEHGTVEYDCTSSGWRSRHGDPRIQRMAECYLEVYFERRHRPTLASTPLSVPEIPGSDPA